MDRITEPFARNAAPAVERNPRNVSRSQSTEAGSGSVAGTADGRVESSSIRMTVETWSLADRKISQTTLERLGVECGTEVFFPELKRRSPAMVFKYAEGWKARAVPAKAFVAGKGFKLSFWNLSAVLRGLTAHRTDRVYIVEGELDACALVEAGISDEAVLSVPNGAKERPADNPSDQKSYGFVDEALTAGLSRAKLIVWCGDQDGPGLALRTDMVRMFGAAKFNFVEWPDGCKDAGDVLRAFGAADLLDRVTNGAMPWPVAGLYRISELPEPPPLTLWSPGFPEWEKKIMLAARTLSVVTGNPGNGKTALWGQIWYQVAWNYDLVVACASFETRPKPHMRRQLRALHSGVREYNMTDDEVRAADAWINDHYLFIVHPEQRPTLEWLLDTAEVAVVRHQARVVHVDPWNRLEGGREARESETDYIGRCLRSLHAFAHDMNVHVQILAHPAKADAQRRNQPPTLEDISGSRHWENAVDQGFVVHRPEIFDGVERKTSAHLYQRKARFEELGFPCRLMMDYSIEKGAYRSVDYDVTAPKAGKKRNSKSEEED